MLKQRVADAINAQINAEFYSAYLYLSMSAYFQNQGLPGFANWMRVQFEEEQFHALKFYDYVSERGGRVLLTSFETPKHKWATVVEVFEDVLKHELHVTDLINGLVDISIEEKDHASNSFFKWFVDEQVEEEANVEQILSQLKLINGKGDGILLLDRELATRVFVPPVVA
jgi:ferritin